MLKLLKLNQKLRKFGYSMDYIEFSTQNQKKFKKINFQNLKMYKEKWEIDFC